MRTTFNLILLLTLSIASVTGSRAATYSSEDTQKREIRNFNSIAVSSGIKLLITAGNEESVRIEASEKIINDVITEVKDGTLHIYMKKKNILNFFSWGTTGSVRAYVTTTNLNGIKSSSGSEVRSENTLEGNTFSLDVSSGGDVNLNLVYRDIEVDTSSGSKVILSGKCKNLEADASSGGTINARNLESVVCEAGASSGGHIDLQVSGSFKARASSGGNIRYAGNPNTKDFNSSSGGSVSSL